MWPETSAHRRVRAAGGFSLIELLVTMSMAAILLGTIAPLAGDWSRSARTAQARARLVQGFSTARALALRNPGAVLHEDDTNARIAAAGLTISRNASTHVVLVCTGAPADPQCRDGGAHVIWRADFDSDIGVVVGGTTVDSATVARIAIDNRGIPIGSTRYSLKSGGAANEQAGTLQ